jgi:hypothetical protein
VSRKTVHKRFGCFRGGAELTEDEQRSGHPLTSKTDKNMLEINEMIRANRRFEKYDYR